MLVRQSTHDLPEIARAVIAVLQEIQSLHHCIPGSAVLLAALRGTGYADAYPLSLRVEVVNADRSHGVRVGNDCDDGWAGHLAVVVPRYKGDRHALIDLTIVQASRPALGIAVDPTCLYVTDEFVEGRRLHSQTIDKIRLTYTAFPDDHGYESARNWKFPGLERATAMVMSRLSEK